MKSTVRARIWSTGGGIEIAPRRLGGWTWTLKPKHWKRRYRATWHFQVFNSAGEVILYDNTGDYDTILKAALIRVEALRHMEIAGHTLKPSRG